MKRFKRAITLALLGAATTLAVAWGLWMIAQSTSSWDTNVRFCNNHGRFIAYTESEALGATVAHASYDPPPNPPPNNPDWNRVSSQSPDDLIPDFCRRGGPSFRGLVCHAAGWPMRATFRTADEPTPGGLALAWAWLLLGPSDAHPPSRPLPLGFAVNTLFYATLWWGVITLPVLIRHRIRTGRGLCPHCAYDLRGCLPNAACPECGHATHTTSPTPPV